MAPLDAAGKPLDHLSLYALDVFLLLRSNVCYSFLTEQIFNDRY